jgi:threonine synthase
MGLPVEKILITSNDNNVLSEWINEGKYDLRDRELIQTTSPAMDILKSSNVERVLYDKFGAERTKELMENLQKNNFYQLTENEIKEIQKDFSATFSDKKFVKDNIANCLKNDNYLLDPHTATCLKAYNDLRENKELKTVICSTAEWTKFSPTIANAIDEVNLKDLEALQLISKKTNLEIPKIVDDIFKKDIIQKTIIKKEDIENEIDKIIIQS